MSDGKREMSKNYSELIKRLPESKKIQAGDLVTELNFINQTLQTLRKEIRASGVVLEWHNGAQSGVKEAPALKSYNTTVGKKTAIIKMLDTMLSESIKEDQEDALDQFVAGAVPALKVAE